MLDMDAARMLDEIRKGNRQSLARGISIIENETEGYKELLSLLTFQSKVKLIGITGPGGAGKSTLLNALATHHSKEHKKTGILAVDPTSPFTQGALLGDRIRMAAHTENPDVFIRSIATRGASGGVSSKAMEITDLMKEAGFDYLFIETVGVGQAETEIFSLADTTVLVLVPGAGDEVQALKSGVMEIADIFVVNKAEKEGADALVKNILEHLELKPKTEWVPPVVKTSATKGEGIDELMDKISLHQQLPASNRKFKSVAAQAFRFIARARMHDIQMNELEKEIERHMQSKDFNLYSFIRSKI